MNAGFPTQRLSANLRADLTTDRLQHAFCVFIGKIKCLTSDVTHGMKRVLTVVQSFSYSFILSPPVASDATIAREGGMCRPLWKGLMY